jgi:serine/threonine-protein kinase
MTTKPLVGTTFAGYRVERVLGRGGMSVVYLAEHPRLKNMVALKLLAPALAEDDLFRERLLRESRLAASLSHPNVIPVYDTGEEDGVLFVSMRYVAGQDLHALIRDDGPLSLADTASVISQAAAALDAAHALGLVHRDVKPANMLLEPGTETPGHVYVADFGLTKHTDARSGATASGVVGTVDYMAPEQIEGRQIDGRADVYALGCVLFECLVGRPPFKLDTDVAVLWAHIREDPPRPSDANRSVPRGFDGIVDRALAKEPSRPLRHVRRARVGRARCCRLAPPLGAASARAPAAAARTRASSLARPGARRPGARGGSRRWRRNRGSGRRRKRRSVGSSRPLGARARSCAVPLVVRLGAAAVTRLRLEPALQSRRPDGHEGRVQPCAQRLADASATADERLCATGCRSGTRRQAGRHVPEGSRARRAGLGAGTGGNAR